MCGITGACWSDGRLGVDLSTLDRMTDVLRHRGPDGRGVYQGHGSNGLDVALGHRRLSIIDVDGGKQPLSNEDGTIWISFNGEIYNYQSLKVALEEKGHQFRTQSDTETIVHLYEEMGVDCVQELRGMFAFAIWDQPRGRLLLARDRLGQKPLVYRHEAGRLLFASEIKSLLHAPAVPRAVDPVALDEYMAYGYVPQPKTMFVGIEKLPPAHYGVYEGGDFRIQPYWTPDLRDISDAPVEQLREQMDECLSEAVRLRLRSDVPLGAFLSGGIDSTAIVGLMQRHLDRPAKTYTMGFAQAEYDESSAAEFAANHLGTEHSQKQVEPQSVELLPKLAWHFDEPFADSSSIPTYQLAQTTREHVTVALTGDGGDELFAGYPRYQTIQRLGAFDRLPTWMRWIAVNGAWDMLPTGRPSSFLSRLKHRMQILREPPDRRYLNWVTQFPDSRRRSMYSDDFARTTSDSNPSMHVAAAMNRSGSRQPGARAMHTDLLTYLPGDLLAKVDICSMAHGLECRSPFLDHQVVELALAIPFKHHLGGAAPKPFLTQTFPKQIPPQLRDRPKMGFCVPLDHWFRYELRDYARDVLLDPQTTRRGYFRKEAIQQLLEQHTTGKWSHGDRIWSLLCLEAWHRTFIDVSAPPIDQVLPDNWRSSALLESTASHETENNSAISTAD